MVLWISSTAWQGWADFAHGLQDHPWQMDQSFQQTPLLLSAIVHQQRCTHSGPCLSNSYTGNTIVTLDLLCWRTTVGGWLHFSTSDVKIREISYSIRVINFIESRSAAIFVRHILYHTVMWMKAEMPHVHMDTDITSKQPPICTYWHVCSQLYNDRPTCTSSLPPILSSWFGNMAVCNWVLDSSSERRTPVSRRAWLTCANLSDVFWLLSTFTITSAVMLIVQMAFEPRGLNVSSTSLAGPVRAPRL